LRVRLRTHRAFLLLVTFVIALVAAVVAPTATGRADVLTNSNSTRRDGWYPDEPALSPQTVSGGQFGRLFSAAVDGQVYAQPLVSNGTLLVATETDNVYGLDPHTGARQWARSLGTPFQSSAPYPKGNGCGDLSPYVGVTGTPVVDPATNIAYFLDKQYTSATSATSIYVAHAIHVATGAEVAGWPITIQGYADNAPHDNQHSFDAFQQLQRPGLLLMNGVVYAAFGSSCDDLPYNGWIVGLSTTAHSITTMFNTIFDDTSGAGIWQAGSGLVSDGPGQILFSTGNGGFNLTGPRPGNQPPGNLAEAVVRVVVQADGTLKPVDFFAPYDAAALEQNDLDFGSGGPVALPDQYFGVGTSTPHLLVMEGKQGYVYLLDRDHLGGYLQGSSGGDGVVSRIGPYGGVWSRPAVWPGDGGYVYFVTANGSGLQGLGSAGFLRAYKYGVNGAGTPTLAKVADSSDTFGFGSGAPVVTSNGAGSGSALLWVVWEPDGTGTNAQLRAYDPVPVNGQFKMRWSAPIGTASKFSMPAIDNGHVYVGTRDGHVLAFWSPVSTPLSASSPSFAPTVVGQSTTESVVFTAQQATTVEGFSSTSGAFGVGNPSPSLPVALAAGETVSLPLTFTPTKVGLASTTLHATTSNGAIDVAVSAVGVANTAELVVSPTQLSLGGTTAGGNQLSGGVTVTNGGGSALHLGATDLPAAGSKFTLAGVPASGATIAPGDSVVVTATFAAASGTAKGQYTGQFTIHSDGGDQTVALTAIVAAPARVSITPPSFDLGDVPLGATIDSTFVLHNSGGLSASFVRSKPPARNVGFRARTTLSEGTSLAAGGSISETVRFSATKLGTFSDAWSINPADGLGLRNVTFKAHVVPKPTQHGYWMLGSDGAVYPFGNARRYGSPADPTVAHLTPTSTALGYWIVNRAGHVYAYGDARSYGDASALRIGEQVTSMSATPTHKGYWLFSSAGRVFARGDAKFYGDLSRVVLNGPVIDSVPTASGRGYYLVASDGGVFAFGDARFHGSLGAKRLNRPVIGLVPTSTGKGYWLVAADGGVFAFGDAPYRGSLGSIRLNRPIIGMVRFGNGYLLAATDGGVFDFSSAPFLGSLGSRAPSAPIVGIAAFDR
jgi:hypothetical protein